MVLISVKRLFVHFDSCHVYIFYNQLLQEGVQGGTGEWKKGGREKREKGRDKRREAERQEGEKGEGGGRKGSLFTPPQLQKRIKIQINI